MMDCAFMIEFFDGILERIGGSFNGGGVQGGSHGACGFLGGAC